MDLLSENRPPNSAAACPRCGEPRPAAAPAGVCPRCLVARSLADLPGAAEPESFGDFTIGELLGRGGMGAVYRARQRSLEREVALKLLPLELLEDEEFLERFEREARLMARLADPAIARVFEAGISEGGQPYLAMELVAGESITTFVRAHGLNLLARLELFAQVCGAVQHAHQCGIIHRDLKPSNVLVTDTLGRAQVKVIDFGLARPAEEAGGDIAIWRSAAHAVGTPVYMSPEQAAGGEVDTRTDVYSLGVILCELLAGALPVKDDALHAASREEIARVLRETPARPPSELLDRAAFAEPPRPRDLRGDLDAICLRALAKDPAARYPTVAALAEDLARHRRCEPVSAMPSTAAYRFGKFTRRNRGLLAVLTGLFLTLAGASIFSAAQAQTARRQRDAAEIARAQAERVRGFLTDILAAPAPDVAGRDVRVIDILEAAKTRAETDLAADPEVLATVRATLGRTYFMLTIYDTAEPLLRAALADHIALFGHDAEATGEVFVALGELCGWTSRSEEALPLLNEGAAILRRYLPESAGTLSNALQAIGTAHLHAGLSAPAEAPIREALHFAIIAGGPENPAALSAMGELANVLVGLGRTAEAQTLLSRAIEGLRNHPTDRMNLATMLSQRGDLRLNAGDGAGAVRDLEDCIALRQQVFGEKTSPVASAMGKLAFFQLRCGDLAAAETGGRAALEMLHATLPAGRREFLFALRAVGLALARSGRKEEAAPVLTEALALGRQFAPGQTSLHAELEDALALPAAEK